MQNSINLKNTLPIIAELLRETLYKHERIDLIEQIDKLSIVALCECGEADCGSFYTITPPNHDDDYYDNKVEVYIHERENIVIEVYDGVIGYVEIMPSKYGFEVHNSLNKTLNQSTNK